jgi:hypothetical protein
MRIAFFPLLDQLNLNAPVRAACSPSANQASFVPADIWHRISVDVFKNDSAAEGGWQTETVPADRVVIGRQVQLTFRNTCTKK